jgi:hypothetical protein
MCCVYHAILDAERVTLLPLLLIQLSLYQVQELLIHLHEDQLNITCMEVEKSVSMLCVLSIEYWWQPLPAVFSG